MMKKLYFAFTLISIFLCIVWYFNLTEYLTVSYLQNHAEGLLFYVRTCYGTTVSMYLIIYVIAMSLSLPGSSILSMAGGMLFGMWVGTILALLSATLGATILFLLSRYFVGYWFQARYHNELAHFNKEIDLHGDKYLLVMRILAVLPFSLVNILSGLTLMPLKKYISMTSIGLIPITLVYAYTGSQLLYIDEGGNFFGAYKMLTFGTFLIIKVILVPFAIKIIRSKKSHNDKNDDDKNCLKNVNSLGKLKDVTLKV